MYSVLARHSPCKFTIDDSTALFFHHLSTHQVLSRKAYQSKIKCSYFMFSFSVRMIPATHHASQTSAHSMRVFFSRVYSLSVVSRSLMMDAWLAVAKSRLSSLCEFDALSTNKRCDFDTEKSERVRVVLFSSFPYMAPCLKDSYLSSLCRSSL